MDSGPPAPAWAGPVAAAMARQSLTQAEVAGALGLRPESWRRRRTGRVRPLTGEFVRLAELLDLPLDELLAARAGPTGPDLELLTERDRGVYRAAATVEAGAAMASVEEVTAFVAQVMAGPWWAGWASEVPAVAVEAAAGRGELTPAWHHAQLGPRGVTHTLHLPPWAWRPLTVIHELAHVAAHPILWARPHGPQFVRLWLDGVDEAVGPEPARRLRAALRREGIGWAPRKRVAVERDRGLAELGHLLGGEPGGGSFA